jgi:DNA-binding transcriptional ArsR family regulator
MTTATIARPEGNESSAYYHRYIARVTDEGLNQQLMDQMREVERRFETVTDRQALARYADGKWSVKEIMGHLCDTERIFSYRLLRIARGDTTPLPGYEQNDYVPAGRFDERPLPMLLAEFRAVRQSTAALLEGLPETAWTRWGEANGDPVTVRALAYIIVGHVSHHLEVLRDRYGLD